jgi:protein gp37
MNNVKKSIGWAHWTINPVKGLCPVGCSYCYARRAYGRNCNATFRDKSIRYDPSVFRYLYKARPGDRIFVGSTIDLFHPKCSKWNDEIRTICACWPELTFIFLTKCPQYLPKEWPENCWVGVSVTSAIDAIIRIPKLKDITAPVKFISFEPLLKPIASPNQLYIMLKISGINWNIIGAQTPYSPKTAPKMSWVQDILVAAHNANVPVFMKSNLQKVIDHDSLWAGWKLRQEFPVPLKVKV